MKQLLLLCAVGTTCFAQQVNVVSGTAPTGFDITRDSQSANYTLYPGNPAQWGNLGAGGYVNYLLSSPGGTYTLQLYYANGTGSSGTAGISVSGVAQPAFPLAGTGGWSQFTLGAPVTVQLPSGSSTLTIAASQPVQAFNLAGILMTPASAAPAPPTPPPGNPVAGSNPLGGAAFHVNPYSEAAENVGQLCPSGVSLTKISNQPQGVWFGDWNTNPQADAAAVMSAASTQGTVPIVVAYNIVNRDCGGYSTGGAPNDAAYQSWIQGLALGVGSTKAVVILEPDALSQIDQPGCLTPDQQNDRYSLLQYAVSMFQQHAPNASVYYDAGHYGAIDPGSMAQRLQYAGVVHAAGFALNVSNYETTTDNTSYGQQISALVGNKHFVIDTSRNGQGPTADHQYCNPPGRGLGTPPVGFSSGSVDALLWVQNPGTSDGTCNGGPPAGTFSLPIACTLAGNANF